MAHITYYTKLGCMTSAKQVALLERSGHDVEVRDLLAHDWSADELLSYVGEIPVAEWFNEKSPRVKSGEIIPSAYEAEAALQLLMSDHLLIHRPLMESEGVKVCGFDLARMHAWVGLSEYSAEDDFTGCSQPVAAVQKCP
jgi:nitrogenase-associated protein